MARKIHHKGILERIGRVFGRKPRAPGLPQSAAEKIRGKVGGRFGGEAVEAGHRGIAARDREMRRERLAAGDEAYTEEEKAKFRLLPKDEATAFVYDEMYFPVHSSNVVAAQYFLGPQKLMVEFGDGAYLYSNVSKLEAISFVQAMSKGGWVWDHLRIKGTKKGHKKPYVKLR